MKDMLLRVVCGVLLFSIGIALTSHLVFGKNPSVLEEPFPSDKTMDMDKRLNLAHNGHIMLNGVVVDENGQYIDGITVEAEKFAETGGPGERKTEIEKLVVNGRFHLDLRGYSSVYLTFKREGYYKKELVFGTNLPSDQEQRITIEGMVEYYEELLKSRKGLSQEEKNEIKEILKEYKDELKDLSKVTEPEVKENNLRVVLEKQGNLTHLIDYSGPLEYTTSGKVIIIDFDIIPGNYEGDTSLRRIDSIHDPKQLPANCVYMVADKDLDGKIATVRKKYCLTDGKTEREYEVPQRIKLIMTVPESGFIEFKPDPNKKMPRQMKESPETGYQNELIIDSDRFERGSKSADIYFYFKIKDKYGRGSVGEVILEEENKRIRVYAPFNLQSDGSRNLETGDRWY